MIATPAGDCWEKRLEGAGKTGENGQMGENGEEGGRREDEEKIGKDGKWGGTKGVTKDWT